MKEMTVERYEKLRKLILKDGISFAFHVWKELDGTKKKAAAKWWLIDGHGRTALLRKMRDQDGYEVPPIPCVEIEAENYKAAKKKVLSSSSSFNRTTGQGLYELVVELELTPEELDDFDIPEIDMPEFKVEFFEDPSQNLAGSESEQGKLDEKADEKQVITCPKCFAQFTR